jgi:hypothetical protein
MKLFEFELKKKVLGLNLARTQMMRKFEYTVVAISVKFT